MRGKRRCLGYLTLLYVFTAPSGPPQSFFVGVDVTSLFCSWDLPTEDDRNGAIVSYNLVCMTDDITAIDITLNPTVLNITVNLYKPSTTYLCTVAASTAVGMGPPTDAITITTDGKCFQYYVSLLLIIQYTLQLHIQPLLFFLSYHLE